MPIPELFASSIGRRPAAVAFARAARMSLVGLLAPGAITMLASSMGRPLAGPARTLLEIIPVLAFAGSGALAASALGGGRRSAVLLAFGFGMAGITVSLAYGSLQGLSGRESTVVVTAVVVPAFALGYAAAATAGAIGLRQTGRTVAGMARHGVVAGGIGGVVALVPFLLAAARMAIPIPYATEAVAVGSLLGCVIVPYPDDWGSVGIRVPGRGTARRSRPARSCQHMKLTLCGNVVL